MSNENSPFKSAMESLFSGMDSFISTKTVIGDAIHIDDTIILPLVDVTFGVGAGAFNKDTNNQGGGGMGGRMTPCAVLVVNNGVTRLINIKDSSSIDKILDMAPDFIDRFRNKDKNKEKAYKEAADAMEETIINISEMEKE